MRRSDRVRLLGLVVPPALLLGWGLTDWAAGLAAGMLLGWASAAWLHRNVVTSLGANAATALRRLLGHSLLRITAVAVIVVAAFKFPQVHVGGVLVGYLAMYLPSAWDYARARRQSEEGKTP